MAIELIATVTPKNNQTYPIVLSNDIKGGLHSVSSIAERDSISTQRLQNGMLCYVENDKMYQYVNGEWIEFYSGSPNSSSTFIVDTYEDMLSLNEITLGTICYVKESEDINLYYFSEVGWKSFSTGDDKVVTYVVSDTPPEDTSVLWIDTSSSRANEDFFDNLLAEVRAAISVQNVRINELINIVDEQSTLITRLEKEVKVLEDKVKTLEETIENGEIIIKPTTFDSLLTEDGDIFITEDGDVIILEVSENDEEETETYYVMTEEGDIIITEDGDNIILENATIENVTSSKILTENGEMLVTELNEYLILE